MIVTADPKPMRRIVDAGAYKQFHALQMRCMFCRERLGQAHHILPRARGGDDLFENFVSLCTSCHGAVHGSPYTLRFFGSDSIRVTGEMVRRKIGAWLVSDDGQEARAYLAGKLGKKPAEIFMQREYGVRS